MWPWHALASTASPAAMNVRKRMRSLGEGCGGRDICMLQLTVQVYREAWRSARRQTRHYGEGGGDVPSFLSLQLADLLHELGKRLIRSSGALAALRVDELIDPAGIEDQHLVLAPIRAVDAQAGEKPAFVTELRQRACCERRLARAEHLGGMIFHVCQHVLFVVFRVGVRIGGFFRFAPH